MDGPSLHLIFHSGNGHLEDMAVQELLQKPFQTHCTMGANGWDCDYSSFLKENKIALSTSFSILLQEHFSYVSSHTTLSFTFFTQVDRPYTIKYWNLYLIHFAGVRYNVSFKTFFFVVLLLACSNVRWPIRWEVDNVSRFFSLTLHF